MIVSPDKFKATVISKMKSDHIPSGFSIGNDSVTIEQSVRLLGIDLNNQLNFNLHIRKICKSAFNQLNALFRVKGLLGFGEKKILINSFILSNFDYCPLVWFISSAKSLNNVENLQKRTLRFLFNDNHSSYEDLLKTPVKATINLRNYRILCTEICKTLNNLNPAFLKSIFHRCEININ